MTSDKNLKLLVDLEILNEREIAARQEVLLEAFATALRIESRTLLDILQTLILPAAMQDARSDGDSGFTSKLLSKKRDLIQELLDETDSLAQACSAFPNEEVLTAARYAQDTIKPLMESARAVADQLEGLVDRRLWPFPTYTEILYGHQ